MTEFLDLYETKLRDRTIEETANKSTSVGHNLLALGCYQFLTDIGASENRNYNQEAAQTMKRILLEEYPNMPWNSILGLRKSILNGTTELKGPSIGAIMRCLSPRVDLRANPYEQKERTRYPEEMAHREAYLQKYPFEIQKVDIPVSLPEFLASHPDGTYPDLERFANSPKPIESLTYSLVNSL